MDELELGPEYVRVLAERPSDPSLAKAATALLSGRSPVNFIEEYNDRFKLKELVIDPTFGAVPIGPGAPTVRLSPTEWAPDKSAKFIVRGFVKAGSGGQLPLNIDGSAIYSDLPIWGSTTCGTSSYVGTADTVRLKLDTATLAANGLDGSGVALAIADTGIFVPRITKPLGSMTPGAPPALDSVNSWTSKFFTTTHPGMHRVGHGTMTAYDALITAPKATLLDIAILIARPLADHTVQATIGAAIQGYYSLIWNLIIQPILSGRPQPYRAIVVNNSWGIYHPSLDFPPGSPGRYIDNPNHPFRWLIQFLNIVGADVVFASGNCGPQCPSATCLSRKYETIMGANAYTEVLTVAGCDTNDALVGYSSQGPSIAGMPQQKPDVTAYTHFLGSKAERIFIPDSGTSAACAVASGCIAALRTKVSPSTTPPATLLSVLRTTAHQVAGPGWHQDFGYGIIDPVAAGKSLGVIP